MNQVVIWITGYSGAGKTTIARALTELLNKSGNKPVVLDGDCLREALGNYDYSEEGRKELATIYAKFAKMFYKQGHTVIVPTISMFEDIWTWSRDNISNYKLIYISVDQEVLESRNQKQLYSNDGGESKNVVGRDLELRAPETADLVLENNGTVRPEALAASIYEFIWGQE